VASLIFAVVSPQMPRVIRKKISKVKASPKKRVLVRTTRAHRRAELLKAIRHAKSLRTRTKQHEVVHEKPLRRHSENPIIEPREHNYWEMKATFNPGAVYADKRVHLLVSRNRR
jgi:hypothetical protein